jgi:predicted membrane channel-forming protein YqfA (hemolysin III family)
MDIASPQLNFPPTFCCNCGSTDCALELQDTRVSRLFFKAGTDTTFMLSIPVCAACHKTTRRRPQGLFTRLLVLVGTICVVFGAMIALRESVTLPVWMTEHLLAISGGLALVLVVLFYRLRRPKPPQTSFYQPVRIKDASVRFGGDNGQVAYLKLGFTNHEYLNVFATANRDAINAKSLAAVKA